MPFKPTEGMRAAARRAKALRDSVAPSRKGMTGTGLARMRQLIAGRDLSDQDVIVMRAWFRRHRVDKEGKGWKAGSEGYPSKGLQAWLGWGGDAGARAVEAWAARVERERSA